MNDNQIYNVIVLTEKEELGEFYIIADGDEDCLHTVSQMNPKFQVVSYNYLTTFKEKVEQLELAKKGLLAAIKSEKMDRLTS